MDFDTLREILGSIAGVAALVGLVAFAAWQVWHLFRGRHRLSPDHESDEGDRLERCSQCGYDLRASSRRCPECGADIAEMRARRAKSELDPHKLRDHWPTEDIAIRRPAPHEHPVLVHQTTNGLEANLLASQLEARGIQAGIRLKEDSSFAGRGYRTETYHLVMVPSGDEELAKSIIDRFRWNRDTDDSGDRKSS